MRQPRLRDFVQPYDKLNHGTVTFTQLLRALEQANITLTPAESSFIKEKYSVAGEVRYAELLQ